jgi:large-conductance mechanosensitive channel
MNFRTFAMNGALRVVIALAIGCVLGIVAERLAEALGRMRVVPAMSNR